MTVVEAPPADVVAELFERWLHGYGAAAEHGDASKLAGMFAPDGHWRDILSLTWDYRTFSGHVAIEEGYRRNLGLMTPRSFRPAAGRAAPRLVRRSARTVIEAYFDFDTSIGAGTGFVRLDLEGLDDQSPKAWMLLTTLQELRGFEERLGDRRPSGVEYSFRFDGDNWLDQRRSAQEFEDRSPQVLVIGAGQSGLALAARFSQIGVDALVVERNERVGDNWRNRYHSLTLHNEVWANSLPYLPFPETWPTFLPKDKLAGWLEGYAEFLELNVWTSTDCLGASFDEDSKTWDVELLRKDGQTRTLRVPHVVVATGSVSGVPHIPTMSGIEHFNGEVIHSSQFLAADHYAGKRAVVVGTGNSGHDVAQELYSNGAAAVSIVQRSSTCVVSLVPSGTMVYALYSEGPPEDIDLITASIPYEVLKDSYQWLTKKTTALDRELLDKLEAVGFRTDFGPDGTGFHMKYLRQGGGYYINVGCSDLIADGAIKLIQAEDIVTFTAAGLEVADGSVIDADLVVFATGYENQKEGVRRLFGDDVAAKVGEVWGFDSDGFMNGMWRVTGQEHFWLMGGALAECRLWSRFLALLIKADIEGISPPTP